MSFELTYQEWALVMAFACFAMALLLCKMRKWANEYQPEEPHYHAPLVKDSEI